MLYNKNTFPGQGQKGGLALFSRDFARLNEQTEWVLKKIFENNGYVFCEYNTNIVLTRNASKELIEVQIPATLFRDPIAMFSALENDFLGAFSEAYSVSSSRHYTNDVPQKWVGIVSTQKIFED